MTITDDNHDMLIPEDGILFVEVVLPDGSEARWARTVEVDGETVIDDDTIDRLTAAIEGIIGSPDTLRL